MRQRLLFIASIAAVLGAMFLVALGLGLIVEGNAGYGLAILFLATPCALGMAIVFDYVRAKMELSDEDLDVDIIRPKFTRFGGGG